MDCSSLLRPRHRNEIGTLSSPVGIKPQPGPWDTPPTRRPARREPWSSTGTSSGPIIAAAPAPEQGRCIGMSSGQAPHMGAGSHPAGVLKEGAADAPFPALPGTTGQTFSRQSSPDLFPAVLLRELRLLHARKSCLRLCQAASTGTLVSAGGNGLGSGRGCRAAWPRRPPTAGCGRRSVTEVRAKTPMNVECSPSGRPVVRRLLRSRKSSYETLRFVPASDHQHGPGVGELGLRPMAGRVEESHWHWVVERSF